MAALRHSTAPAYVGLPSTVFECPDGFYVIQSNDHTQAHAEDRTILLSSTGILPFEHDIYTWIIVEDETGPQLYAKRIFTPLEMFTKHLQLAADVKQSLKKEPMVIYAGEMKGMVSEEHVYRAKASTKRVELPMATKLVVNLASGSFAPEVNEGNVAAVCAVFQHVFPQQTIDVTTSLETVIPKIGCAELMERARMGAIDLFRFRTRGEAEAYKRGAITLLKEEMKEQMATRMAKHGGPPYVEPPEIRQLKMLMATPKVSMAELSKGKTKKGRKRKKRTVKN